MLVLKDFFYSLMDSSVSHKVLITCLSPISDIFPIVYIVELRQILVYILALPVSRYLSLSFLIRIKE